VLSGLCQQAPAGGPRASPANLVLLASGLARSRRIRSARITSWGGSALRIRLQTAGQADGAGRMGPVRRRCAGACMTRRGRSRSGWRSRSGGRACSGRGGPSRARRRHWPGGSGRRETRCSRRESSSMA
jgi:hypothetical protein